MSRHCGLSQPRDLTYRRVAWAREKVTTELRAEGGAREEIVLGEATMHALSPEKEVPNQK